ncbi:transcriptional repressor DicA [compost metagenome]
MSTHEEELLFLIAARLREERSKIGESQSSMAEKFGVSARTWGKYERGETMPDALTLSRLGGELGIDVAYVLTGQKTSNTVDSISMEEQKLIENYRAMDEAARLNIQAVGDAFAQSKPNLKVDG